MNVHYDLLKKILLVSTLLLLCACGQTTSSVDVTTENVTTSEELSHPHVKVSHHLIY